MHGWVLLGPDGKSWVRLPARAAASYLSVDYQPRDAQVRINNGPELSVAETISNPVKVVGPEGYGLEIVEQLPISLPANPHNARYLETKRERMGHRL